MVRQKGAKADARAYGFLGGIIAKVIVIVGFAASTLGRLGSFLGFLFAC